jgi:hypothetical protein
LWVFCSSIGFYFVFVCVSSYGRGGQAGKKKKEEREENEEQPEEHLKEASLLQSNPYKPTIVVEVCCHSHELSIAIKGCCFH